MVLQPMTDSLFTSKCLLSILSPVFLAFTILAADEQCQPKGKGKVVPVP
jgi:hypothetical protein